MIELEIKSSMSQLRKLENKIAIKKLSLKSLDAQIRAKRQILTLIEANIKRLKND